MRTAARTTAVAATQALRSTRGVSPCRPPGREHHKCWAAHPTARVHHLYQLDAGVPLRDVQEAASHADPHTTMRYDPARTPLDRHALYIVAAYVAGVPR